MAKKEAHFPVGPSKNDQNAKLYFQNVLGREKRVTVLKSGRFFGSILDAFWSQTSIKNQAKNQMDF